MNRSRSTRLGRRPAAALTALAAVTATVSLSAAGVSPAASAPVNTCPDAYPVSDLTRGQAVDGLTVSQGTTPDAFSGEVLGVLKDGIAPGLDMILVRLTNPEIDRVGGIWAGMSGSPVYAADGRLIGAVSYGLATGPSTVAGVTPAADMQALLGDGAALGRAKAGKVRIPAAAKERLVKSGALTATQADGGLSRLPLPVAISGMANSARLATAAKHLPMKGVQVYRAGAAPAAAVTPADAEIFPGGNLAASLSYGDFSAVGVGTVTMVCDQDVVGFGHPFNWSGNASLTLHGADALYIQEDPTLAPFKVANPTGPVGVIDQDRFAGIKGSVGTPPDATAVTSLVSLVGGGSRTGNTFVSVPEFLPDASALANLANQDRVIDKVGTGSSLVHFIVDGTTADGEPFTLVRTNRFASQFDISYESIFELADDVYQLQNNDFTDVTIDSVRTETTLDNALRSFTIGKVEARRAGVFHTVKEGKNIKARAGKAVVLRVTLNSFRNKLGSKVVKLRVPVPDTSFPGQVGELDLSGAFSDEFFDEGVSSFDSSADSSFSDLVDSLANAPRNDQLQAQIFFFDEEEGDGTSSDPVLKDAGDVVEGSTFFGLKIIG